MAESLEGHAEDHNYLVPTSPIFLPQQPLPPWSVPVLPLEALVEASLIEKHNLPSIQGLILHGIMIPSIDILISVSFAIGHHPFFLCDVAAAQYQRYGLLADSEPELFLHHPYHLLLGEERIR